MTSVLVVGAGLGGLTAAIQLAEAGLSVTVVEASDRAGGKAGSYDIGGKLYDHGWHGFPGWYLNTRALLDKLGVQLVGFQEAYFVDKGPQGGLDHAKVLFLPTDLGGLIRLLTDGFLPPAQMTLYLYYLLDTMAASLSNKSVLDRISRTALMRGKWYVTELIVTADSDSLLKGTAIPAYEMSAMTWKIVLENWARSPQPFMAVLPGDMQTTFIQPLLNKALSLGVNVIFNERVESFAATTGKVTSLTSVDVNGNKTVRTADYFVMGAPSEVARKIMGWPLLSQDPKIGEFQHLTVIPMGSLHLKLNKKLPNVPKAPVFFKGGRYALSFVDMSQITGSGGNTVLSFVTSNNVELIDVSTQDQLEAMMGEVTAYLGITMADVDSWEVISNVNAPLAVNDIAAWPHRPTVRSDKLKNLVYACDWAQTRVDLCCMEGAVAAAMEAAHQIASDVGKSSPRPQVAPQYPRWLLKILTWILWPIVPPAWLWAKLFEPQDGVS
ncbi:MAG: FAD-dependent oxidoreductase [Myxococcota bacterium]